MQKGTLQKLLDPPSPYFFGGEGEREREGLRSKQLDQFPASRVLLYHHLIPVMFETDPGQSDDVKPTETFPDHARQLRYWVQTFFASRSMKEVRYY